MMDAEFVVFLLMLFIHLKSHKHTGCSNIRMFGKHTKGLIRNTNWTETKYL